METPDHIPADYSGIFVPRIVLEDNRLSHLERLLFGMVDGLDDPGRGCFGSNAYFCRRLGASQRSVQNALNKLEMFGYLKRGFGSGSRVIKTVTSEALEGVQKSAGGMQKTAGGGCRKLHPYRKEDRKDLDNPPTPLVRGASVRRRALKVNPGDYSRGF